MPIGSADLSDLLTVSRFAGGDVLLAQGGGGNTSVKSADGRTMWIKASGFRLAEVTETAGYLAVDLPALQAINADPDLAAKDVRLAHDESIIRIRATAGNAGSLRPSLEAGFHAALPHRVVLHTHSVMMNVITCLYGLSEAHSGGWPLVEYATPGYALGVLVDRTARANPKANGFLLANHGVITAGDTAAAAIAEHNRMTAFAAELFGDLPPRAVQAMPAPDDVATWAAELQALLGPERTVRAAARGGLIPPWERPPCVEALVPDDVVYGLHDVRRADGRTDPERWLADQPAPLGNQSVIQLADRGFVLIGPSDRNVAIMEENLLANVLIRRLIGRRIASPNPLPADEVAYLAGMESEHYRQAVAAGRVKA